MGNLNNMRKHLYPGLQAAYEQWLESKDFSIFEKQNELALEHWQSLCQQVLDTATTHAEPKSAIEDLIESRCL